METLDAFLSSYGYWVFFAVGFAEFVGVPIVSVPVLIGGRLICNRRLKHAYWHARSAMRIEGSLAPSDVRTHPRGTISRVYRD